MLASADTEATHNASFVEKMRKNFVKAEDDYK